MQQIIYELISIITRIHQWLLTLNDSFELYFTDKQLHFLVIGLIGMGLLFVIHPLFTLLAKTNHILVASWLYVFTVILVLTFAVEIGQWLSGTGTMDFEDVTSGIRGFLLMFLVFAGIRAVVKGFIRLFRKLDERAEREEETGR